MVVRVGVGGHQLGLGLVAVGVRVRVNHQVHPIVHELACVSTDDVHAQDHLVRARARARVRVRARIRARARVRVR